MSENKYTNTEYPLGEDGLPLIPEKKIIGCPKQAALSKTIALDAHKLITVLERMVKERFTVSLPKLHRDFVFKSLLLNVFRVSEATTKEILDANQFDDDDSHPITLPRDLLISDFQYIPATKEVWYQDLKAVRHLFRNYPREEVREVDNEIKQIGGIMDNVLGIKRSEKEGCAR